MSLLALCEVIFFLGYGIHFFYPNRTLALVVAVVALIVGILMLLGGVGGIRLI
ncbi:MAG: hypothetical protein JO026_03170 [Patescibacteria group bacterium]|nr:hypothetical protein [Patescibacteria group bacterium]